MIREGIRRAFALALRGGRRDRWEREVEDEIQLHLMLRAEQLLAEGRSLSKRRFPATDQGQQNSAQTTQI
jgi:hypothetical protein